MLSEKYELRDRSQHRYRNLRLDSYEGWMKSYPSVVKNIKAGYPLPPLKADDLSDLSAMCGTIADYMYAYGHPMEDVIEMIRAYIEINLLPVKLFLCAAKKFCWIGISRNSMVSKQVC